MIHSNLQVFPCSRRKMSIKKWLQDTYCNFAELSEFRFLNDSTVVAAYGLHAKWDSFSRQLPVIFQHSKSILKMENMREQYQTTRFQDLNGTIILKHRFHWCAPQVRSFTKTDVLTPSPSLPVCARKIYASSLDCFYQLESGEKWDWQYGHVQYGTPRIGS